MRGIVPMVLLLLAIVGCGPTSAEVRVATDHLFRASILVRSRPPLPEEVLAVRDDPAALSSIIFSWDARSPALGALIRDLHAEDLLVRHDTQHKPPLLGPLGGFSEGDVAASLDEAPLRLIEHIVRDGRPYTDLVTTSEVLVDPIVSAAWGPPHLAEGPEWQVSQWQDGRPEAGVLSSTTFLLRHPSGNLNHHRSRAAVVTQALLCDDVTTRAAAGAIQPEQQEQAAREDPDCVACHAVLDPVASAFFGFRPYVLPRQVQRAYQVGDCETSYACYPLAVWDPSQEGGAVELGLPAPALYGERVTGLADLGRAIAADPRFSTCAVRRFWSYLARVPRDAVPPDAVATLSADFEAHGWDAGRLVLDVVAHPQFAPTSESAPAVAIRPHHLARTIEAITGFVWEAEPNADYGAVNLATTDRYGMHTLLGGLDGWRIVGSEPGALPTRELAMQWFAEEAALHVVDTEMARSADERELLIEGVPTGPGPARQQLAWLHLAILGEVVGPQSKSVDADWRLLSTLLKHGADPERAWAIVLSALFQHPRLAVL